MQNNSYDNRSHLSMLRQFSLLSFLFCIALFFTACSLEPPEAEEIVYVDIIEEEIPSPEQVDPAVAATDEPEAKEVPAVSEPDEAPAESPPEPEIVLPAVDEDVHEEVLEPRQLPDDIRVMSYNVRFSTAPDGENAWPYRKDFLMQTIRDFNPDLLGTQEVRADQAAFLRRHLDEEYVFHGAGRSDGEMGGELVPLFFKRARFEKLDAGHIWLSEQPLEPGSKSWDSALPRMFSWVKVRDLKTNHSIVFANTHWDHRGIEARNQSAILMRQFISLYPNAIIILSGDFNRREDHEPYRVMIDGLDSHDRRLIDSYRYVHPVRDRHEATFHGFTGRTKGSRIDWILHSEELRAIEAEIIRAQRDGRYPSDHYPITAILRYQR